MMQTRDTSGALPGALIVGASSGMGAALARRLAAGGFSVTLVARRESELNALAQQLNAAAGREIATAISLDVRDLDRAPEIFDEIVRKNGRLDLFVYTAGTMPAVTTGAAFDAERDMVETNLLGAMRWLSLAAAYFKAQKHGTLVGVSSVAGERGRPGNGAYMASKSALTTYLDSLRFQLAGTGVRVVVVKPGFVDTPMVAGKSLPKALTVSADAAAAAIVRACRGRRNTVYVPGFWSPIMWMVRHMPASLVARMPG